MIDWDRISVLSADVRDAQEIELSAETQDMIEAGNRVKILAELNVKVRAIK